MKVYKNFLSKKDFKALESIIMSDEMPWYFNNGISKIKKNPSKNKEDFQFTFTFMKGGKQTCSDYMGNILYPIFSKLKFKKMSRIKANLIPRKNKIIESGMHTDQKNGITGILYINTCNGYTLFENNKKIKSEKNKYVEFNSVLKHTGSSCTDQHRRVVINFNYQQ
tara:strand:- start:3357 stop:3854 length:498 start_codon:yes stop_codon:yes gene_type:complete